MIQYICCVCFVIFFVFFQSNNHIFYFSIVDLFSIFAFIIEKIISRTNCYINISIFLKIH